MTTDISYLPIEMIEQILLDSSYLDILNFCTTNKYAYMICNDYQFWILKLEKDLTYLGFIFPSYIDHDENGRALYERFIYASEHGPYSAHINNHCDVIQWIQYMTQNNLIDLSKTNWLYGIIDTHNDNIFRIISDDDQTQGRPCHSFKSRELINILWEIDRRDPSILITDFNKTYTRCHLLTTISKHDPKLNILYSTTPPTNDQPEIPQDKINFYTRWERAGRNNICTVIKQLMIELGTVIYI